MSRAKPINDQQKVPMLHRLVFVLMAMSLLVYASPAIQKEVTYSVRGRVVDESGLAVAGARVFLDQPVHAHQVFGTSTDESGRFCLVERITVLRGKRRLYVTGPEPANAVRLVYPPFNLLPKLTEPVFAGLPVQLVQNKTLEIGDVLVQVTYSPVSVYVQNGRSEPLLRTAKEWKSVYLRLRDRNNRNIVMETTLSQINIENAVNLSESSITLALPEGVWRIELSISGHKGPWIASDGQLNVTRVSRPSRVVLKVAPIHN